MRTLKALKQTPWLCSKLHLWQSGYSGRYSPSVVGAWWEAASTAVPWGPLLYNPQYRALLWPNDWCRKVVWHVRMRIKMKTLLFVNPGGNIRENKLKLDMEEDLVKIGCLEWQKSGLSSYTSSRKSKKSWLVATAKQLVPGRCLSQNPEQRWLVGRRQVQPGTV